MTMTFAELEPSATLAANFFGILEPKLGRKIDARELDLVLTPLVAFDDRGVRIGVGRGYYDRCFRFLRHRSHWRRPKLLGVAYELQRVPPLDAERLGRAAVGGRDGARGAALLAEKGRRDELLADEVRARGFRHRRPGQERRARPRIGTASEIFRRAISCATTCAAAISRSSITPTARSPAIVGIVKIVREGYPDHTAFDASDAHFDRGQRSRQAALVHGRRAARSASFAER